MDLIYSAVLSLAVTLGLRGCELWTTIHTLPTFLVLLAAQYIVALAYQTFLYPFFLSPLRSLPGPKDGNWFFGQVVNQLKAPSPVDLFVSWSREWPDAPFIRYLDFGNKETLLVNSLPALKDVLQTHCYSMVKPPLIFRAVCEVAGFGVFAAEGDAHKKQRRLLGGPFSSTNVRKLLPVFQRKAQDLGAYFESQIGGGTSAVLEMKGVFDRATLDVIGTAIIGSELNNLRPKSSNLDLQKSYERMLNQPPLSALITFIHAIVPIRWLLPIEANLGFVRASKIVRQTLRDVIQERVQMVTSLSKNGSTEGATHVRSFVSRDILTYMIEEGYVEGSVWTVDEMLEHLMNFVAAGFETTATCLVWATYILATYPTVQSTLREEIVGLLKSKPVPEAIDIERLHYLNNFLREVLRLYSPSTQAQRVTIKDLVMAGVQVPKGTTLYVCPQTTNRSHKIWGPTADEFHPERWDNLSSDASSPYAVESFINGPRICIGKQFAILEMKAMLVEVVSKFRFNPSKAQDLSHLELMNPSLTLRPQGGLLIEVQRV